MEDGTGGIHRQRLARRDRHVMPWPIEANAMETDMTARSRQQQAQPAIAGQIEVTIDVPGYPRIIRGMDQQCRSPDGRQQRLR